jgi:glyoxylase-like metal-dependent hydrolase (beta-lactamase superfamily II)
MFLVLLTCLSSFPQSNPGDLKVMFETTGIFQTNCYLICDIESREAALIDPGDKVPRLMRHIEENGLELKYILITHCHPDHIYGIIDMDLREKYPDAKVCFSSEEYEDMFCVVSKWRHSYPEDLVNAIEGSPPHLALFDMDYDAIGGPDIIIEDLQVLDLGSYQIKAIKTPGHARGSISYYVDKYLFSGDELQSGKVGGTRNSPISSFDRQVLSIRKLYSLLPDETIVYPGHGTSTTIGHEKMNNRNITLEKAVQ